MLITLLMGFSSGLPLILTGSTLQAWMTETGVDLGTIGLFSLIGLPYTLKFVVAPLFDRFLPPLLAKNGERRKGWILIFQLCLMGSIFGLSLTNPKNMLSLVAALAVATTTFSALQDIIIDAYRREILTDEELGLGSSLYTNGYRIAMLLTGAGALFMAEQMSWNTVYAIMAGSMSIGIITTLFAPATELDVPAPTSLKDAVVKPFVEYFTRKDALIMLAFILLYKIGDTMAGSMTTPFILKMGFSKSELASVAKTFGMFATIGGALLGGVMMLKMGINKSLWIFGGLQALSTFGFALLAKVGYSIPALAGVIAFENLSSGMGTAAYAAFMASLCDKRFTATQYALLTSLMGVPRVIASAPTGFLVQNVGWETFFIICTLAAIPGMLLLFKFAPWTTGKVTTQQRIA